jgi:hypothetical protein
MHSRFLSNLKEERKAINGRCTIACILGKRKHNRDDDLIDMIFERE